jgi:hypothetical protein
MMDWALDFLPGKSLWRLFAPYGRVEPLAGMLARGETVSALMVIGNVFLKSSCQKTRIKSYD